MIDEKEDKPQTDEERRIDILETFVEETHRWGAPSRPLTSDERTFLRRNRKNR